MKKILFYTLLLAVALTAGSCRRAAEKARQKIRVETIEKFERHGTAGVDLTLRVANGTGYKLALNEANFDLFIGDSRVGSITLREPVEVPRRATTSVAMQWQLKISDPLALYVLVNKIQKGDLSDITVTADIKAKGGPKKVEISREKVPVSEILRIFGVSMDDVKHYLKD